MSDARNRARSRVARASADPLAQDSAIMRTLRVHGYWTALLPAPSIGGHRRIWVICNACGGKRALRRSDLLRGRAVPACPHLRVDRSDP